MNSTKQPGLIDAPIRPEADFNEQQWQQQVTESLRVGLGQTGDQSQKFVTWSDMEEAGMVENAGGSGSGNSGGGFSPAPITQPPDLTPPPPLKNVAASGGMTAIYITWDSPKLTYNYYVEVHKAGVDDVSQAVLAGTTNGNIYEHVVGSDKNTYWFWVRVIKQTGGELVIGPWQGTYGVSAAAALDPEWLLDQLEGQIGETELNDTLNSEIDKIAPIETSVGDIQDDIKVIDTSIGDIQDDIKTIDLDIDTLETGLTTETTERQTDDLSLHTRIDSNVSRIDGNAAAIVTEQTTRATEDEALATSITTLKSEVDDNSAAIQTESTTRATEDEAIAGQITTLQTNVGNNSAALQTESEARASEDEAIGTRIDTIVVNVGENAAAIQTESEARASEDEAIASQITTLRSDVDGNAAAIQTESTARSDADTAQAGQITTLQTDVEGNTTAIQTESSARSTADEAIGTRIDTIVVDVGNNSAAIQTESEARADQDEAIATQITTLVAEVGENTAAIQTESETRVSEDGALATQITTLESTVDGNTSAIQTESTTRASEDEALASQISTVQTDLNGVQGSVETNSSAIGTIEDDVEKITTEYSVKLDSDGYVGGFGLINDSETITALWRVDVFAVGAPGSESLTFAIDTKEDRVVMSGAYIENGTINDAQIGTLTVDTLTGDTASWVNANIDNGSINNAQIGSKIYSENYYSDPSDTVVSGAGWLLNKDGFFDCQNAFIRGRIHGSEITGSVIQGSVIIGDDDVLTWTEADGGPGTIRYLTYQEPFSVSGSDVKTIPSSYYDGEDSSYHERETTIYLNTGDIKSANYEGEGKTSSGVWINFRRYKNYEVDPDISIVTGNMTNSQSSPFGWAYHGVESIEFNVSVNNGSLVANFEVSTKEFPSGNGNRGFSKVDNNIQLHGNVNIVYNSMTFQSAMTTLNGFIRLLDFNYNGDDALDIRIYMKFYPSTSSFYTGTLPSFNVTVKSDDFSYDKAVQMLAATDKEVISQLEKVYLSGTDLLRKRERWRSELTAK